jgi:integrase
MTTLETAVARSRKLRPRTKELYLQHVRAFLSFVGEQQYDVTVTAGGSKVYTPKPSDFTQEVVIAWRDDMRKRRIRPESVNVALNALRYAAQRAGCTFVNGIERLPVRRRRMKAQAKIDRALTWEEGRKLIDECIGTKGRDLRDNAIITLGLRTGMLRFSMCQLRFEDITTKRSLTFTKKGGERHTITLDYVTYEALRAWIDWLVAHDQEDGFVFRSLGRQRVSPKDEVAIGNQLTPDGLYRALRERAHEAGFDDLKPHVFRKTFLAWAKKAGAKPHQIEAVTGHKSDGIGDENGVTASPANMLLPDWDKNFK